MPQHKTLNAENADVGDLIVGNADTTHINLMLIIGIRIVDWEDDYYIVSKNGRRMELKKSIIQKYIDAGKVRIIKRHKPT